MSSESDLYPKVDKYLVDHFSCAGTKINTGTRYGHIDVLGLRERRSNFASQTEIIAVEVKRGGTRFLNFVGQAVAYSLYAHRVYLAWEKKEFGEYTQEEIDIASKFGVGLLRIGKEGNIRLVSSSSEFVPEHHHLLQAIDKLGYFECTLCRSFYKSEGVLQINQRGSINIADAPEFRGNLTEIIKKSRPALYYLFQLAEDRGDQREYTHDKRYLCRECSSIFASFLPKSA
jgi:hypothetical protein